jgi:hypothetical protein
VTVTVMINGESACAPEPSHVHVGRCPVSWAEINSGKYVVMVHRSAQAMGTYETCANIGARASSHH